MNQEIIGMVISPKIMFNDSLNSVQQREIMCQIENEFSEVISKHKNLIGLGGKGEWIYRDNEYENNYQECITVQQFEIARDVMNNSVKEIARDGWKSIGLSEEDIDIILTQ